MKIGKGFPILVATLLAGCATMPNPKPMLDLKITNGRIVDGTGAPWFRGDVGIDGDTIVAIGDLRDTPAQTTLDAHDLLVSPGFIDLLGWSYETSFTDPQLEAKLRQGVTTEVGGEGTSPAPQRADKVTANAPWRTMGEFLDALDKHGAAINFAMLVGASNAREMVIGDVNRAPTMDEMRQMEAIVDQAMRDGAIGISTSLIYLPAMYSTTDEIINLAKVAAKYDGMYFTHMRDEGDHIDSAMDEAFRIGREAHIPVNIWHLKVGGRANWGKMPHVIERIEAARAEGVDVAANVYPYAASGTGLSTLVPDWAMEGGYAELRKRLGDPEARAKIAEALRAQVAKRGERGIYITQVYNKDDERYTKMYVPEIAAAMQVPPEEAMMKLFETNPASPRVIFFSMSEDDVRTALKQPWISVGSDGSAPSPAIRAAGTAVHPRSYGTFARVAGHYVRDAHLFSIEEAVRKMTSQAALRANLHDRGILRAGMKADIIVFDPNTIADIATFEDPHHMSVGVRAVVVNGMVEMREGEPTAVYGGRVIRGKGYREKR
jgi:N-acyl-D-amino-acid deacylase